MKFDRLDNVSISYDDTFTADEEVLPKLRGLQHNHYHDVYEVILSIESNNNFVFVNDASHQIVNSQMMLIPPGEVHRIDYEGGNRYMRYVLHFSLSYVEPLLKTACGTALVLDFSELDTKIINLNSKEFSNICTYFANLLKCYRTYKQKRSNVNELNLRLLLAHTLIVVHKLFSTPRVQDADSLTADSHIKEIVAYLKDNYMQPITLEMLAKKFYLSRSYISHKFKEVTGMTLIEYLHCVRIAESQRLLSRGDVDISRVYELCGFNNVQHFYRVFNKVVGMSPGAYFKVAHALRDTTDQI